MKLKFKLIFAWYDLWVGIFIDKPKRKVYIFLLPMLGIVLDFEKVPIIPFGVFDGQRIIRNNNKGHYMVYSGPGNLKAGDLVGIKKDGTIYKIQG